MKGFEEPTRSLCPITQMSPPVDPMSVSGAHTLQILSRTRRLPWGHGRTRERSGTRELGLVPSSSCCSVVLSLPKAFYNVFPSGHSSFHFHATPAEGHVALSDHTLSQGQGAVGAMPAEAPQESHGGGPRLEDSWHWPPTVPCQVLLDEGGNGVFASGLRITVRAFPGTQRCIFVSAVPGSKAWLLCGLEITQTLSPLQ